ncbi:polysaccharide deacetylase family protein [Lederbergia panacisoli]|uniref:polysaccharide deacetylase family protein n=1 Tax=Lederbergia panacisoli TaxID=1255251 RepID=UPI00214BBEFF|nr:polysaccharide deacetylase family protein [Lederbergia panacisoli]MCR2823849.1 polysaccharide deacetylase family protein [Lederbergia panacisoli]
MKGSGKKRRKLNRLGKITLGSFILFCMVLTYFIWDGIAEKNAAARKNILMPTKIVENVNAKDRQSDSIEGKTNMAKEKNQDEQGLESDEQIIDPKKNDQTTNDENKKHEQELEKHKQEIEKQKQELEKRKQEIRKHEEELNKQKEETEKHKQEIEQHQKDVKQHNENSKKDQQQSEQPANEKPPVKTPKKEQPKEKAPAKTGKIVYLTFDDGPHAVSMDILKLLKKYNAKATFFMLEPNMRNYPKAVKAMVKDGHAVGVHGVSHDVSKVYRSPASFVGEMNKAIAFIQKTTNVQTHLIRAPYGSKPYVTAPFKAEANKENMILWDWNIDSTDWKMTNGAYVNSVIQQTIQFNKKEPLIVLMHEKPTTLAHLEKLLKYYKDNGYEMKAVDETMSPVQFK